MYKPLPDQFEEGVGELVHHHIFFMEEVPPIPECVRQPDGKECRGAICGGECSAMKQSTVWYLSPCLSAHKEDTAAVQTAERSVKTAFDANVQADPDLRKKKMAAEAVSG